jgi:glycosyltransferase involved in cell wall biosynthesis/FMN phosphatase YigB (HAD superfamily)/tetratricopeptide (TPR) repeat protein
MDRITSIADFYSYAAEFDYVSFDLFDTILKRRFLSANQVHDTVSVYLHGLIGKQVLHPATELTALRWAAGSALKSRTDIDMQEPTAAMVWDRLLSFEHGLTDRGRREALANQIVNFEHELELRNLALVNGALDLLTRLKAEGKTLIAISDMYFGSEIIEGILDKLGVLQLFDHVYVSAEVNLTKYSGDLFRRVLKDLDIQPHQLRHVGDNHHSDVAMARDVGIPCVFCEQEHLLRLERPDYGKRAKIEEDIADVVKAHLFSVLLDAQETQATQIYFMGRDGCTTGEFLTNWQSPLVSRFLPPPEYKDIFLNRVLTIWANVDFTSSNWLEQAVGIAFWLKEGKSLPAELCDLLGTSLVPATLGTRLLVGEHDTGQVVKVLREAGLEAEIKANILANCAKVERYLEGEGFFDQRSVLVSDVGYSGSVLRALNRLLLNRPADAIAERVPPLAKLHLIATYSNYEVNRVHARPTVQFADKVVLPFANLPKGLRETFAWIEYFFKHPTLRPVLELTESSGKVGPLLVEETAPETPIPSQRLQQFAIDRDEDIALLWMAAVGDFTPLSEGVLERFAKPDAATVAQMRDEIFELDSVRGTRRSVVLEIPGADPKLVAKAAIAGDYWVPGSIAASAGFGSHANDAEQSEDAASRGRGRWLNRSIEKLKKKSAQLRGFDPVFYREFYPDLRQFRTDEDLLRHYVDHGRKEGRLMSPSALRAQLRVEFGIVPEDFNADAYLYYNPDVAAILDNPHRILDHYMRIGRREGRRYAPNLDLLLNEFEVLRCNGLLTLSAEESRRLAAGDSTLLLFLRRHGLKPGPWLDLLQPAEFRALHVSWCGRVSTRAECILALCEKGLGRAPSLSLETQFDPDFYRAETGSDADLPIEDLYRHYLNIGSSRGVAPSEMTKLLRIWGHSEFPDCLDWQGYRHAAGLVDATRSDALKAFADDKTIDPLPFVLQDDSAQFLTWLAVRQWRQLGKYDRARSLFKAARERGGDPGILDYLAGEMELAAGEPSAALAHFRRSTNAAAPNRWSFTTAATMLLDRGDYKSALSILHAGRDVWQENIQWRIVYERAMYDWSRAFVGRRAAGSASLAEADAIVEDIRSRIPAPFATAALSDDVLVLTGRTLAPGSRADRLPNGVTILDREAVERGQYLDALLRHGTVIFHEMPFTYHVLHAALIAQRLGKNCVAWVGDLARWGNVALDEAGSDQTGQSRSQLTRENLRSEFDLVARYCPTAVSTIPGSVALLAKTSPDTKWHDASRPIRGLRRGQEGKRVALVLLSDSKARVADLDGRARQLLGCVQADPRLHLLVSREMAVSKPFGDMAGRWSIVDTDGSLPDLARLLATCDLLIEFVSDDRSRTFDLAACAAGNGVPAIVLPLKRGKSGEATDLSQQVKAQLDAGATAPIERDMAKLPSFPVRPQGSGKKRLLLVNAWAPPQVIGGASRVLKDNLDYFIDRHGDEFEIAVFAGDDHREGFGNYSVDTYRGVPVFRLALPPGKNVFWQPDSAIAAASFASVLESFGPDLVHVHCLQRLTGSIAESCRTRGIPYVVTLHDAWWLSDFPFLANSDGLSAPAFADYSLQQRNPIYGVEASTLRAEGLRQLLLGARRRLAVSRSFANLYGSVGIPCDVIENGNSKIAARPRTASGGPVQICHLGGLERHKGAFLIEAALRKNDFSNIEFTMVDLTQDGGVTKRTVWGSTPVNIIGKLDTEGLGELYARMHVLVAPSTCHESFGLVVHEALAHGLWVIASDRGALSEPVEEGVNGYVIHVSDAEDISRVLSTIDANPTAHQVATQSDRTLRDVDDQSRDLVTVYRDLLGEAG